MSTRAIQFLKQNRVAHDIVSYEHDRKGAEFAAQAVGFPLARTIKTLVVSLDSHSHVLALMPGDCRLSLKKTAAACKAKRAAMADTETAQRLTGYLVGGISPFGTKKKLAVMMDKLLLSYEKVMINAGRRGMMVKIAPEDIAMLLRADTVDLIQL